ncbi:NAD-dependent epimerase [Longispora fulva]|uniref:Uncharacterized protein YbjT (DUF2867 family) n=1 Tax=Longispora fulva TaxID=619741 RepID=A0A8J7GF37_9ACTN|nr:NAD(P)H-binding protein [Longispora fulva]MBG6137619.1 uncharacterized protein YbjT (DUF2867 family) [Longispora fulva]GIG62223.1 NAD-dependent epimerase [Longispora fulva]
MTTLITGARGKVGRAVLDRLRAADHPTRAASKNPAELTVPAVELDLTRPTAAALDGIRQVFLYPEPDGIADLVTAAESAGVEHIVLLSSSSVLGPDADTDPLARPSLLVERALADSPITTTVLRPDAFASNALGWAYHLRSGHPIRLAFPDAGIAPIHPDDVADLAVAALTGDALTGRAVTLTGGESVSFRAQLDILAELLGREIPVERITRAEAEEQFAQHMPPAMAAALHDLWEPVDGHAATLGDTTETLLGRPARTFAQWAAENLDAFRPQG